MWLFAAQSQYQVLPQSIWRLVQVNGDRSPDMLGVKVPEDGLSAMIAFLSGKRVTEPQERRSCINNNAKC